VRGLHEWKSDRLTLRDLPVGKENQTLALPPAFIDLQVASRLMTMARLTQNFFADLRVCLESIQRYFEVNALHMMEAFYYSLSVSAEFARTE
jgi:hypothetical protein